VNPERTVGLQLVVPGRPMNMNDRHHWADRSRLVADARADAFGRALEQWGRAARARALITYPVDVVVADICHPRLRDTLNAAPAVKAVIDGLTDYGLWPVDDPRYVRRIIMLPPELGEADQLIFDIGRNETV